MKDDKSTFLIGVNGHLSPDGTMAQLEFLRPSGSIRIDFPVAAAGVVMLRIEEALGRLRRVASQVEDERGLSTMRTRDVVKIDTTFALGKAIVSFVLNSDVRLDLSFNRTQIRELIDCLEELESDFDASERTK